MVRDALFSVLVRFVGDKMCLRLDFNFFSPSFRRILSCEHESGDAQEQSERNISGYFTFCVYFRSSVSVRLITRFEYDFKQRRATEEKMIVCFTRKFRREFKLKQWNTHEALKVEW